MMPFLQPGESDMPGLHSYSRHATSDQKLKDLGSALVYNSNTGPKRYRWCRGEAAGTTNDHKGKCTYPSDRFYDYSPHTTSVYACAEQCSTRWWCNGFVYKDGQDWLQEPDFHRGSCQMMQVLRPCGTRVPDVFSYVFQRDHMVTTAAKKAIGNQMVTTTKKALPVSTLLAVLSGVLVSGSPPRKVLDFSFV